MNPNQAPTVAPAGNPEPQGPVTVQSLAADVANAPNDPAVTTAANNANTAMAQANSSQQTDYTLPQLLQQALIPTLTTTSSGGTDPDVAKSTADLATYLTDLKNPGGIADAAANGAVLSPSQVSSIIAGRLGNEAANLSQDNLISGMRSGGIGNIIKNLSMAHQQQTQQYLNAAALARQVYEQALNKAQLHQQAAESAAGILNASRGLDIQEKGLGIQQQQIQQGYNLSPVWQTLQTHNQAMDDVKSMKFNDYKAKYANNPFLSPQQASQIWNEAHPNQPMNIGAAGQVGSAQGGITSIQQLIPGLSSLLGGGSTQNNNSNRPPLSSFDH